MIRATVYAFGVLVAAMGVVVGCGGGLHAQPTINKHAKCMQTVESVWLVSANPNIRSPYVGELVDRLVGTTWPEMWAIADEVCSKIQAQ